MQNIELYINDQLVDLSEDSLIELSFQINNLADVQNQAGNTSKQFKLPLTQRNRQILGFPDDMRFTNSRPYEQLEAKVVVNGVEVIPKGTGEINSTDDDSVDLVILSGNVDFFDALGGNIYEMGDSNSYWTGYGASLPFQKYSLPNPEDPTNINNLRWDVEHVARSQNKTDGWIWPIIDYGNIDPVDFTPAINVRQMRPGFFLHSAVEALASGTGYSINPDSFLLRQELYKKLIVQFSNDSFEHGTDYQNQPDKSGLLAYTSINQGAIHQDIHDAAAGILQFGNIQSDPSGQFDGGTFTAKQRMDVVIELVVPRLYLRGRDSGDDKSNIDIEIYFETADGTGNLATPINYDLDRDGNTRYENTSGNKRQGYYTFGKQSVSTELEMLPGDKITARWNFRGKRPEEFRMYAGASLSIKTDKIKVLYGQNFQAERILPDVSQKDFLKDTLQRFGITCQCDNYRKQITFSSFRDIVGNIPNAKDWTLKCIDQGKKTVYDLGGYSQLNWMRYQDDDTISRDLLPKYFADDVIKLNNKTINPNAPQADLFVSIYGPSINRPWYGGTIAQILKIDPQGEDPLSLSITTKPRLLVDQKLDLRTLGGIKTVTFTDGTISQVINDWVSVPYFYKPGGENLCFCDKTDSTGAILPGLRSTYYPELEHILMRTKKITRYFMLTPRDITELDLLIPVYLEQDSAYFYINKIENWKQGTPTKVELVRL